MRQPYYYPFDSNLVPANGFLNELKNRGILLQVSPAKLRIPIPLKVAIMQDSLDKILGNYDASPIERPKNNYVQRLIEREKTQLKADTTDSLDSLIDMKKAFKYKVKEQTIQR